MNESDVKKIVEENLNSNAKFDPFTILMIISLIMTAIRIIQQCKASKTLLKSAARRKGLAYRMFVKNKLVDPMIAAGLDNKETEELVESLRIEYIKK